jgi:hypothetical protein
MSTRTDYPSGVPCWVDTLQPDPHAAVRFYAALMGWEFAGPGAMAAGDEGYFVARLGERDVAGVGGLPRGAPAGLCAWNTYIRVADADAAAAAVRAAGGEVLVAPCDVPPAGRFAVLKDPTGAVFNVWEAWERKGAQLINAPRCWAMSALDTSEPVAAAAFYDEVFGWQAQPMGEGDAAPTLFRLPGYVGGEPQQPVPRDVVAVMLTLPQVRPHWSVDFWVSDADTASARAWELGGKVVTPPADNAGFRSCVIEDPHGAVFSVSQLLAIPVR